MSLGLMSVLVAGVYETYQLVAGAHETYQLVVGVYETYQKRPTYTQRQ